MTHQETSNGPGSAKPTETRLQMRITEAHKAMLERAATVRGQTLTEFVLQAALPAAQQTITEQLFFSVSAETFRAFTDRLDEPARDNPRLRAQMDKAKNSRWYTLLHPPSTS